MTALLGDVRAGAGQIPRPLLLAGAGLILVAVALVAPLVAVGLLGLVVVVVGGLWLEAGFVLYFTSQHFVLFAKRAFVSGPLGLALDGALFLMLFGLLLRLSRPGGPERLRWRHPLVAAVLLLKGYQILDAFNPESLGLVFSAFGARQMLPNLAIFMLTVYLIADRRRLGRLLALWFALLAVVAGYALWQQVYGFSDHELAWMYGPDGQVWRTAQGVLRVYSTLTPDTLGISMAYAITLGLALILSPVRPLVRLALIALIPVCALAMLYSGTRSAYAAALAGCALVVLFSGRWYLYAGAPLVAAMAAVGVDWSSNYWGTRFLSAFNPERDASFQIRQEIIGGHLSAALNSPFGNGTATTSYASFAQEQLRAAKESGAALASGIDIPTDNNYFLVLLENGVVGGILFLLVILAVAFYAVRLTLTVRDRWLRAVSAGLAACTLAAMVASLSNNYLEFWGTWVLFGLVCAVDRMARGEAVRTVRPTRPAMRSTVPATSEA